MQAPRFALVVVGVATLFAMAPSVRADLDLPALRAAEEARSRAAAGDLEGSLARYRTALEGSPTGHAVMLARVRPGAIAAALRTRRDLAPLWVLPEEAGSHVVAWGHFVTPEEARLAAARVPVALVDGEASLIDLVASFQPGGAAPAPAAASDEGGTARAEPSTPEQDAGRAAALFQEGNVAVARADYPAAIAAFERSLELDPDNARTLSNLGTAWYLVGDPARSEETFRRAIAIDPGYSRAHLNLGSALYALDRLDEARVSIEKAIALEPGNLDARHNLAALLVEQRRWTEALGVLQAATALAPGDERFQRQLDQVNAQIGVRRAQPQEPGAPAPAEPVTAAPAARGEGPCDETTSRAARARLAQRLLAEGRAAYERDELDAAEIALDGALECEPTSATILNHVGAVAMARRSFGRAESAFRLALGFEPGLLESTVNLALAIFEGGRCEEAIVLLETATREHPEAGEAAFQLARARQRCGQPEKAREALEMARRLLPGDARVDRLAERLGATPP